MKPCSHHTITQRAGATLGCHTLQALLGVTVIATHDLQDVPVWTLSSMCKLKVLQGQQGEKQLWWHLNWRYSGRETNLVVTWEMNGTGGRGDRRMRKGKREEEMMIRNDMEEWKRRPTKIKSKSGGSREKKGERGSRRKREKKYLCKQSLNIAQLCPALCDLMDYTQPMEFSRPEYW